MKKMKRLRKMKKLKKLKTKKDPSLIQTVPTCLGSIWKTSSPTMNQHLYLRNGAGKSLERRRPKRPN